MSADATSAGWTSRGAIGLRGGGVAAATLPAARAQTGFPKGAVIRTLLKDYAPEELAGGATLFHEHLQLGRDFNQKFTAATAAVRAANGLPPAPARGGGGGAGRGSGSGRGSFTPPPDIMHDVDLMAAEVAKV